MQTARPTLEKNQDLMKTRDDAWNTQDWDTFKRLHAADCVIYWPGQPTPTRGREVHLEEAKAFFRTFPDNHISTQPYKILFSQGDWTGTVADFTGTMTGPLSIPTGGTLPPTNKRFTIEICSITRWRNDEITEERLFYDEVALMRDIGYPLVPQEITSFEKSAHEAGELLGRLGKTGWGAVKGFGKGLQTGLSPEEKK